ncbi:hypothetical protein DJ79_06955 [Halorubrum ezzemoulense]|uniref:Uncharacterized protein n=1 Tax=Halorubrum ezzemoulense TaxID=337243 RepID=A0A256JHT2_HALEZ|nr:hypothetical protein [Halorubrum ezzemoulense]OYR67932.1 hypothetical protein DJ79_06955 [Halorubrum ezzemoulense]
MRYGALLALCVVLAGCGGSLGPGSAPADDVCRGATGAETPESVASTAPPDASRVEVRGDGDRLPVNATVVWLRVLDLHGLSPAEVPAPVVRVAPASEQTFSQTDLDGNMDRFGNLIGLNENQSRDVTLTSPDGYVAPPDFTDGNYSRVNVGIGGDDPVADVEATLAHEYVHVVQIETDFCLTDEELTQVQANVSPGTFAAVREGAAEYVADVYAERYLEGIDLRAERRAAYERARPNAWKLSRAGYYYGYRHVAARAESPRQLPAVYETPPETTEQLVHGLRPDEAPPVPLSVRAGEKWQSRGTVGELRLQVALTEGVAESRAAEAAAGWGNDTLLRRGDDYVWIVRMDDAANASDLETALESHVDGLAAATDPIGRPSDIAYRVVRVDEETLGLVVGESTTVESLRISAEGEAVNVSTEAA